MEKNEILLKAQQENKGKDVADIEAQRKATNIGFMVGGLVFMAILVVEMIMTNVMHYEIMGGLFLMLGVSFLVKYGILRKTHELVTGISYSLISMGWFAFWILRLCKVI